jgi:MFS family permease
MKGTVGSVAGLAGAALGGWYAFRAGRRRALLVCGLLQTASLLCYVAAAFGFGGIAVLWAGSVAEHLFGGMATVALFTLMMDASDPEHAGTDYTLLACAIVFAMGLANFAGATIADAGGYAPAFVAGFLLSGIGCVVLVRSIDARRGPARLQRVWQPA